MRSIIFILLLGCFSSVEAQPQEQTAKFRLAQTYEQSGDFERALTLYRQLYNSDSLNYVYFDGLRRTLTSLKQYDSAVVVVRSRIARNPEEPNLYGMLGSIYYQAGEEKEAIHQWDKVIAIDPTNANLYRLVANYMLDNRLVEKAIEVYRRARTATNDSHLFTLELAQILVVSLNYADATKEYLRWLEHNPTQLGFIQSRMSAFTGKEEGRAAAAEVIRGELDTSSNVSLYRLLAWLSLEGKHFDEAFDLYTTIDRLSNAHGAELYGFADRVFKEGAYAVAARAYQAAIAIPLSSQRMPYAKYGYANAVKEMIEEEDTVETGMVASGSQYPVPESRYGGAIEYFRQVIQEYPHTEFSAKSYYQIGTLQFRKFFDLDGALRSFEMVQKELPGLNPVHFDVALRIGEVFEAMGDAVKAAAQFKQVANAPQAIPDQQDEATYHLAEIEYFDGHADSAITLLKGISSNLKADYANDALLLLAFLHENTMTAPDALRAYANADFLARQHRNTEAIAGFQEVIKKYPQSLLVDDALMKVANLQTRAGRYEDAVITYQTLLDKFKESSIALDRAQYNIARLYDFSIADKPKAIAAYEKVLAEFPQSVLAAQARRRIRELRGDSL